MNQDNSPRFRIVALSGSARPNNYTDRALAVVIDAFHAAGTRVDWIHPRQVQLTLPGHEPEHSDTAEIRRRVQAAHGVILATPEYHGSYSSIIKLFIENLGFPSVLAGQPVALLGVAAGDIGAIKALEHLRSVCSHVGALVLPGSVSVARAHKIFDDQGNCSDPQVEKRLRLLARSLLDYLVEHACPTASQEAQARSQD